MSEVSETTPKVTKKSRKFSAKINRKKLLIAVIILALVGAVGYLVYQNQNLKKNPNKIVQADQKKLVDKVGAHIDLPKDEQPSIATVSDKEKLKEQAFFKSAQNGDTLLIYTKAKKAILYRDKEDRVIEVAPIAIDTSTQAQQTAPAQTDNSAKKQ
jgi:uncharacterized protein HemX